MCFDGSLNEEKNGAPMIISVENLFLLLNIGSKSLEQLYLLLMVISQELTGPKKEDYDPWFSLVLVCLEWFSDFIIYYQLTDAFSLF